MFEQILLNGIITGSIYALVALGFTIIYKTVKFFHFAHGVIYTIGAYLAYTFSVMMGINPVFAFILAVLLTGGIGTIADHLVYYPLRKKKAPSLVFLIASFGLFIFLQNLIQLLYGAQLLTLRNTNVIEGHHILGAIITDTQIIIITVTIILLVLLWLFIQKTQLGKAIRAVADDPIGASSIGIYPEKIILMAFFIGSSLAGVAGILTSLETNISPTMGLNAIFKGMVASIIGGIGSIEGAVFGGFFLGMIENISTFFIPAGYTDIISFLLLILFLLARPQGIFGVKNERADLV